MAEVYEIRVRERLDTCWVNRFDGFAITYEEDDTTVLTGPIVDQAALHGLLMKVRDLGLTLLSVNQTGLGSPASDQGTATSPGWSV